MLLLYFIEKFRNFLTTKLLTNFFISIHIFWLGNLRIKYVSFLVKILDAQGEYLDDIEGDAIKGGSTVGMVVLPLGDILTLNWRTKELCKCSSSGELLQVN